MSNWEEQVKLFEQYVRHVNNPATVYRMKSWFRRLAQIRSHPECMSLEDLGVSAPYTVDLSLLYPHLYRRRAA